MPLHDIPACLAVVHMGMVSPLGSNVATSCASARAGLSRRSELAFNVVGPDKDPVKATGHQADFLTRGFRGDARLTRLLAGALDDLVANLGKDALPPGVDLFLAMPASYRDDPNQKIDPLSSPWESARTSEADALRGRSIVEKALTLAGVRSKISGLTVITQGQASVGVALEAVAAGFHNGNQRPALILAVDSPVDPGRIAGFDAS
jgi:3-oxoacyl-[acyl-carrier-protein] synthase-1